MLLTIWAWIGGTALGAILGFLLCPSSALAKLKPKADPKANPKANPCAPNPEADKLAAWVVDQWQLAPGDRLADKVLHPPPKKLQDFREAAGATRVPYGFRDIDFDQTPLEYLANWAYWCAHPKGPNKIPSRSHPCGARWFELREKVAKALNEKGLV